VRFAHVWLGWMKPVLASVPFAAQRPWVSLQGVSSKRFKAPRSPCHRGSWRFFSNHDDAVADVKAQLWPGQLPRCGPCWSDRDVAAMRTFLSGSRLTVVPWRTPRGMAAASRAARPVFLEGFVVIAHPLPGCPFNTPSASTRERTASNAVNECCRSWSKEPSPDDRLCVTWCPATCLGGKYAPGGRSEIFSS